MNNTDRTQPEEVAATPDADAFIARIKLSPRDRVSDGRDAWSELRRAAEGRSKRAGKLLSARDRELIARNLYRILDELGPELKRRKVSRTYLCQKAFGDDHTDSRELSRLTLPPEGDFEHRGIRRPADKFRRFIGALAELSGTNVSLLADRALWGSSMHPKTATIEAFDELEQIQALLQEAVNRADANHGVFRAYQETARAKALGFDRGRRVCWPMYDVRLPHGDDPSEVESYRDDLAAATDPAQCFWQISDQFGRPAMWHWFIDGSNSGVVQDSNFFYVPHCPLGHLILWDLPDRSEDETAYDIALAREIKRAQDPDRGYAGIHPQDGFDEERFRPVGQTIDGSVEPHEWRRQACLQNYFWLVIYPDPTSRRLVPALYSPGEEGGAFLLPIDVEVLAMLRHAVWVSPSESMPVVERLRALLLDRDAQGRSAIDQAFDRTSPWLLHNPHLQWLRKEDETKAKLAAAFRGSDGNPV